MPKMKTHSGAKKRFRVTGSGKVMHERVGKRHLLEHKSSRVTRRLSKDQVFRKANMKEVRALLGR
ncbi:MAG: 50S ribosomal protein L35 [Actinomycetaceae bacterium]|nr:50S ribosomal protein L35 [Actinomycetaceae bacterium]MDY6083143.1 50S ribosomal protein L35 [Actinomycetaceae bacterium]